MQITYPNTHSFRYLNPLKPEEQREQNYRKVKVTYSEQLSLMEDHLYHRLSSEVEHALDSHHQPGANKNRADEPHVSEVRENMSFSHIPES